MADVSTAMGPEGKVALNNECTLACEKIMAFQDSVNGVIGQIQGVIDGLKSDYSGDGANNFYAACNSNIAQMKEMVKNICEAYGGETGLFKSIEQQILTAEQSLNETLITTNQSFNNNASK